MEPSSKNTFLPGRLHVICGPMFSQKTKNLIELLKKLKHQQKQILGFKHCDDKRNHDCFHSRLGARFSAINVSKPETIFQKIAEFEQQHNTTIQIVAFDEVHFFSISLLPVIKQLLREKKMVFCAGLDRGFSDRILPIMDLVRKIANQETLLHTKCGICGQKATKTQRINQTKKPINPNTVDLNKLSGGTDIYQARCQKCFKVFSY